MQLRELHRFFELLQKRLGAQRIRTFRGTYGAQRLASKPIWAQSCTKRRFFWPLSDKEL